MRRLVGLMALLTVTSCGSGVPGPGGVELALRAFGAAFETVAAGLTVAFEQGTTAGEVVEFEHTLLCDPEGISSIDEKVFEGEIDGTFLVEADLDQCNGVGGEMSALGSFARSPEGLILQWVYEGVVKSGPCDVELSGLSLSSSVLEAPALSLVTGELAATCTGTSPALVRCDWDQAPVLSRETLLASCHCTGSGC
jgi:hypothetical protein